MAYLFNTKAMWDFQHAPSRVAGGHPSQHVQQMSDGGPQPIGPDSDTMLRNKVWNKIEQRHGKRMNSDDFILHL
jgi:hypothetical protein